MNVRFILLVPLLLILCGCVSKKSSRANARAAYASGQASAYRRMLNEARTSVQIIGNVKHAEIAWEDGMTLAGLLLVAEYQGENGPEEIIVQRKAQKLSVDMKALLDGEDYELEPGDTVIITP